MRSEERRGGKEGRYWRDWSSDVCSSDLVVIEKAGDVIPRVVAPIPSLRPAGATPWVMPTTCRACGSELYRDEEEVVWRCENTACPARLRRGLEHYEIGRASGWERGEILA